MSEYSKTRYYTKKALHLCVQCGIKLDDDYNKVTCEKCGKMQCERVKAYRQRDTEKWKKYSKNYYRKRVEAGICARCGQPSGNGRTVCNKCSYALSSKRQLEKTQH